MKKLLLILLSLVFISIVYADIDTLEGTATSGMSKWEGQTVAGGTGGTSFLVGTETIYSGTERILSADEALSSNLAATPFVATGTGDIAKGYIYISHWWALGSGEYCKMLVYQDTDDTLITQSALVEGGVQSVPGWVEFTFSSGSISASSSYHLAFIADAPVKMWADGTSNQIFNDSSGTVASPPDPISSLSNIGKHGGMYLEK